MAKSFEPADQIFGPHKLIPLAIQHVLVMYAGAVAVPLIVSGALGLTPELRALLINADLLACGLATIVQSAGFPGVGIRLPVMMGVTFASVAPMLAMINAAKAAAGASFTPTEVLLTIYGAVIAAGIFAIVIAPFVSRLLALFPPLVTGSIITIIGVSLMRIGVGWAEGPFTVVQIVDGAAKVVPNPNRDALDGFALALFVLVLILAITKWSRGFIQNIAVLLALVAGATLAYYLGKMNLASVHNAPWLGVVYPFQFGIPQFHLVPILTMCIVMVVVMIESTGMFLALSEMTGKKIGPADLTRGLRGDGIGTIIGGIFNTFPYTSFSQNVGLVGVTGVRSRWVTATGGVLLIALGFIPKLATLVGAVPVEVLGGAGIVMFGMVAATGIRILGGVNFKDNRNNLFVVAISIGFGLIPLVAPTFFKNFPVDLKPLLDSGIILTTISAVILNLYFNGLRGSGEAAEDARLAASAAEA
ncbi:MAG: nucleobase:cation symporter-2 family protein [Rhodomicrobium sp.]